jgi:hypothetical protein
MLGVYPGVHMATLGRVKKLLLLVILVALASVAAKKVKATA